MNKIKPLSNNIIIELVGKEKENAPFQMSGKDEPQQGKVVFVGQGKVNSQGKHIPMQVRKGDIVLFNKYRAYEIKIKDKEYLVVVEDDVIAVLG